jgi:hypothetical protein
LDSEKLDNLLVGCITDSCRGRAQSRQRQLTEPIGIFLSTQSNDLMSVEIGYQYRLHSMRQLDVKIRQFPQGTEFYFPASYQGVWYYEQRIFKIRRILESAGMLVVPQPARN